MKVMKIEKLNAAALGIFLGFVSSPSPTQEVCNHMVEKSADYVLSPRKNFNNEQPILLATFYSTYNYNDNMVCVTTVPNAKLGFTLTGDIYCYHGFTGLPKNPNQKNPVINVPTIVAKTGSIEVMPTSPERIIKEFKAFRPSCLQNRVEKTEARL